MVENYYIHFQKASIKSNWENDMDKTCKVNVTAGKVKDA